jgi:hypothetical protein
MKQARKHYTPQKKVAILRWHQSLKAECVRPGVPLSLEDARRLVGRYVEHYNAVRLHSAIGYVTPQAKLEGRQQQIFTERDRKLEEARRQRQLRRQQAYQTAQKNRWRGGRIAAKLILPGGTQAGSAGKQPRRGIAR